MSSGILDGKVAVVTGAARGLGLAIASRLNGAGATVVLSDVDATALSSAAAGLSSESAASGSGVAVSSPPVSTVTCDVTNEASVKALVDGVVSEHGRLDVMVACAGIASVSPLTQLSLDEWHRVLAVDLDGVFLCTKHAGAAMAAGGGGSIINVASIKAFGGSPAAGAYGAAKAGVVSLTKTAALELRAFGVRANAICPGWVSTDMVTSNKAEFESVLGISFDDYIAHIQGRLGEPDEIAGLAVFLASERSRFCSGSAYVVDGGATASLL
ncbi:MAG: SDR family NAD(P)-dependent oxidoreductase [Solirubrobacteraceae bacterium]